MVEAGAGSLENIMRICEFTFDVLQIIVAGAVDLQGCESSQHLRLPLIDISLEVIPAAAHHTWPQRVVKSVTLSVIIDDDTPSVTCLQCGIEISISEYAAVCYLRISSCVTAQTV